MSDVVTLMVAFAVGVGVGAGGLAYWFRRRLAAWSAEAPSAAASESHMLPSRADVPDWLVGGLESVEGIGYRVCEVVHGITGRPSAVVMRDPLTDVPSVVAISAGADRRLLGSTVEPGSAAGRASMGDLVVAGTAWKGLLGTARENRRRRDEQGVAFPLRHQGQSVGALVVFGTPELVSPALRERLKKCAEDAGPRLGEAAAAQLAAKSAETDELVGLPSREVLERVMQSHHDGPCSLLCVDIDRFPQLGSAAGDAALKHLARIFRAALRGDDVPARVGEEEFALLLPDTPGRDAIRVADRVRMAVRESVCYWGGGELKITCSIGVASVPETVSHADQLLAAANAALARARESGPNRVAAALPH